MTAQFPSFAPDWEPTRSTLHAYAHGASALSRSLAPAHPKWWHASLSVRPSGLVADTIPVPGGGALEIRMEPVRHQAVLENADGMAGSVPLDAGATGTEFAEQILDLARTFGVSGDVDRTKFEDDGPREYDRDHATTFWAALTRAAAVLERHRRSLDGPVSPVQMWPHNFDLSFEWFGTRTEHHEERGELTELPSQINFGFYPGDGGYFYANPWPFEESLLETPLPGAADWHTEGWSGTMLRYEEVAGRPDGVAALEAYMRRVFEVASPTLLT